MDLPDAVTGALAELPTAFAVGTVTAVAPRLTVSVRGAPKTVGRLASYTAPAAGDVVLLACVPQSWCALGKIT